MRALVQSLIARLIAFASVALLFDAAIGSVHGAMTALAAAGGGAALALVVLALVWPRPWVGAAFAVLILLAAFVAGTLNGAVGNGPALIGLSPSDAAAVPFGVGIIAAAVAGCLVFRTARVRTGVLALAAFSLATTLTSIGHGGLATAFASAPLAWTRGPYLAAELFLPAAAIAAFVFAGREFIGQRPANGTVGIALALALVAATQLGSLAAAAAGLPTIVAFEQIARADIAPAGAGPLFIPKGSADVAPEVVAAASLAPDPQHALAAVAGFGDDLYPGALAGAVGTLRSGSANSIDKALLLHDLIRAGTPAVETAFARCTLPSAQADALVAQARNVKFHPKIFMQAAADAADGATDPATRATLRRWAQTWKALVAQTQAQSRELAGGLQTAGLTLPADRPASDRLRALAAQHVWLRARINGDWVDLDPTIEPPTPGKTRCAAQMQTAALPDDLYDVLGVRIAVETLDAGALRRTVVFDRSVRTSDIGDRDVSFMFAEPLGMSAAPAPVAFAPAAPMTFTPLLRVGDENLTGVPVVLPALPEGSVGSVGRAVSGRLGSVVNAFGVNPTPTPTAIPTPLLPTLAGAWMELSVAAPGSATTLARSPIFDRIGYPVRAAHATLPALAVQPDFDTYGSMQTIWNIAVSAGHASSGGGPSELSAGDVPGLSAALARLNSSYFSLRRALVDDATGANVGVAAAQPGISLLAMQNDGAFVMDIASDGAVPLTAQEARPTWAAAAVLAERAVVKFKALTYGESSESILALSLARSNDALATLYYVSLSSAHFLGLRPADAAAPQASAIPAEARARMAARLSSGTSVLAFAPDAAYPTNLTYAYWIVDPIAGTLRDENAFGRHADEAEETEVTKDVALKNVCRVNSLANKVVSVARMAVLLIGVVANASGHGGSSAAQLARTIARVAQAQAANQKKGAKSVLDAACKNGGASGPPDP